MTWIKNLVNVKTFELPKISKTSLECVMQFLPCKKTNFCEILSNRGSA